MRRDARQKLREAGSNYTKLNEHLAAGRCFFSAESYQEALECFDKAGDMKSMGQCYFNLGIYMKAADLFLRSRSISDTLESLDASGQQ